MFGKVGIDGDGANVGGGGGESGVLDSVGWMGTVGRTGVASTGSSIDGISSGSPSVALVDASVIERENGMAEVDGVSVKLGS